MTASLPETGKLPVWRLIAGLAVLGILLILLAVAGRVYMNNFMLDRYMRGLAAEPASATLSDAVLSDRILERAKQLNLPVQTADVSITRENGRLHIQIARYGVQTKLVRMDLRLPEAASH